MLLPGKSPGHQITRCCKTVSQRRPSLSCATDVPSNIPEEFRLSVVVQSRQILGMIRDYAWLVETSKRIAYAMPYTTNGKIQHFYPCFHLQQYRTKVCFYWEKSFIVLLSWFVCCYYVDDTNLPFHLWMDNVYSGRDSTTGLPNYDFVKLLYTVDQRFLATSYVIPTYLLFPIFGWHTEFAYPLQLGYIDKSGKKVL